MEAACSLDVAAHSSAFGRVILHKKAYKTIHAIAHLPRRRSRCSALPSAFLSSSSSKYSPSSSSCQLGVPACFAYHPLDFGASYDHSPDLGAGLDDYSYLALAERVSASSVHSASAIRNVSWEGRNNRRHRGRRGTHNRSSSVNVTVFADNEWRKLVKFGMGNASPVRSRAMMATKTTMLSAQWEAKHQSYKMTCLLSHAFGAADQLPIKRRWQPSLVFLLRRSGKRRPHGGVFCEATQQSGTGQPVPEEENPETSPEQGPPVVPGKNSDIPVVSRVDSETTEVDWRAFRARLVVTEHTTSIDESEPSTEEEKPSSMPVSPLGTRWAHPILAPEAGCVLIATDKIDGQQSFERSVILLLSPGSSNPREGPYGLILNRPLSCRIKDIKPKDRTLVKVFGNCQVHHGGPLDEDMFLLLHGTPGVKGYKEVIPGVYYGAASGLEETMKGKRSLDYRFFFGYSGWGVEQLKKEIDAGLWCVAACSTDLITGHSAAGLWEEILLLMGGKYGELSKRPRRRHF